MKHRSASISPARLQHVHLLASQSSLGFFQCRSLPFDFYMDKMHGSPQCYSIVEVMLDRFKCTVACTRQHVIITGGNTGIGKATAMELARKGMSLTLACRNQDSGMKAAAEITSLTGNNCVRSMQCDLASSRSVREFAEEYRQSGLPLHVLINNAGIMACPLSYTMDGYEQHFGVNHVGHFLLIMLLSDILNSSASIRKFSRIVVLASAAERIGNLDFDDLNYTKNRAYNRWLAYGQSKLANCLFSLELSRRCKSLNLPMTSNCMHPGIVDTQLIRYVLPQAMATAPSSADGLRSFLRRLLNLRSPQEGAATAVHLAASEDVEGISGQYFEDSRIATPSVRAQDAALAKTLWKVTEELTAEQLRV